MNKQVTATLLSIAVVAILVALFWDQIKSAFSTATGDAANGVGRQIGNAINQASQGVGTALGTAVSSAAKGLSQAAGQGALSVWDTAANTVDGVLWALGLPNSYDPTWGAPDAQPSYQPPSWLQNPDEYGPIHSPDAKVQTSASGYGTPDYTYTEKYSDGSTAVGGNW